MLVSLLLFTFIEENDNTRLIEYDLLVPMASVFGFIPVFIYAAWVGNNLLQIN